CMLWAQPEHLAFAVLEAEDVESALQFLGALVPQSWTYKVRPVWNLPSQLRLIRQVQLAPTMLTGDELTQPDTTSIAEVGEPATVEPVDVSDEVSHRVSEESPREEAPSSVEVGDTREARTGDAAHTDDDFKTQPPVSVSFPPGEAADVEDV